MLRPTNRTRFAPESELVEAGFAESRIPDLGSFFRPSGCQSCSNTGYRGRIGLYEVMPMTEEIERLDERKQPPNGPKSD